jgi:hypothetical protein
VKYARAGGNAADSHDCQQHFPGRACRVIVAGDQGPNPLSDSACATREDDLSRMRVDSHEVALGASQVQGWQSGDRGGPGGVLSRLIVKTAKPTNNSCP